MKVHSVFLFIHILWSFDSSSMYGATSCRHGVLYGYFIKMNHIVSRRCPFPFPAHVPFSPIVAGTAQVYWHLCCNMKDRARQYECFIGIYDLLIKKGLWGSNNVFKLYVVYHYGMTSHGQSDITRQVVRWGGVAFTDKWMTPVAYVCYSWQEFRSARVHMSSFSQMKLINLCY